MFANQITKKLRKDANEILSVCLEAADPEKAVRRFVRLDGGSLRVDPDFNVDLADVGRIVIVGAGKGSAPMAKALEHMLGDRIHSGAICVKYGHGLPLKKIRVFEAGHPVPDASGQEAAQEIMRLLAPLEESDLVISCISGGGSALLPAPVAGITLEDKQELTRQLLAAGADIYEINAVRRHLSASKAGRLMRLAYPAFVINLMLSDVVGDDPATIASGPFAPDGSTFADALSIIERYELMDKVSSTVAQHIRDGADGKVEETPKQGDQIFSRVLNVIVGSSIMSLEAGCGKAEELGYRTLILSSAIEGDTAEAARFHGALADEITRSGHPLRSPACLLSGGETTVVVKGTGLGGRNQHFVLSLVRKASKIPNCLFLSAGSDGTDGPTDAAGAVADNFTLDRAQSLGLNPDEFLKDYDSYHFFEKLGDLLFTGPTRTNVMDIRIVLIS
jgi:glycerate 2-kinase